MVGAGNGEIDSLDLVKLEEKMEIPYSTIGASLRLIA